MNMVSVYRIMSFEGQQSRQINRDGCSPSYFPPHLFVESPTSLQIFTENVPEQKMREPFFEVPITAPVRVILRQSYNVFFVIEVCGHVQCWIHKNGVWSLHGQFDLTDSRSKVTSIVLQKDQRTVYWCEWSETGHRVCKRTLPPAQEPLNNSTIGSQMVLLTNIPCCDIYVVDYCLILWPRQPCPPGLFMKWFQQQSRLEIHVLDKGCVWYKEVAMFSESVDFMRTCMELVAAWCQPNNLVDVCRQVVDIEHKKLYVIFVDGKVFTITNQSVITVPYQLDIPDVDGEWLVHSDWLINRDKNRLRLFDKMTGRHVQDIDITSYGDLICVWTHWDTVQTTGFIAPSGVYQFHMNRLSTKSPDELLERAQKYFKQNVAPDLSIEDLKSLSMTESPGLILPVMVKSKDTKELSSYIQSSCLDKCNQFSSGMNAQVAHHVNNFWSIQRDVANVVQHSESLPPIDPHNIKEEVSDIMRLRPSSDHASNAARLEVLSKEFPSQVLECLLDYLQFDSKDVSAVVADKWQVVLARESSDFQSTFSLFEVLIRLLYTQQPELVVKFLKVAEHMWEKTGGTSAFSRRKLVESALYERALSCLPSPCESSSLEAAVFCKAQLILKKGDADSCVVALQLFHDHGHWEAGLGLLSHMSRADGLTNELFHILVTSTMKNGVFGRYSQEIIKLMPDSFNVTVLLDLLEDCMPYQTEGGVFVKADDMGSISFDCLRTKLMEFVRD